MSDNADMGPGAAIRRALDHGAEGHPVPRVPHDRAQQRALTPHDAQRTDKFGLDDQEPLVSHALVDGFLDPVRSLAVLDHALDRVADLVDQPLTRAEAGLDPGLAPVLVGDIKDLANPPVASAFA